MWMQALDMCIFYLFSMPTVHFIDLVKAFDIVCQHTEDTEQKVFQMAKKKTALSCER